MARSTASRARRTASTGIAVLLEIQLEPAGSGGKSDRLDLTPIGPDVKSGKDGPVTRALYRRHFIDLAGNGVRDLCWDGDHLLILAGPTTDLDATPALFVWKNAAKAMNAPAGADEHFHWLPVKEKPNGDVDLVKNSYFSGWRQPETGKDHAESIAFRDGGSRELLIAYDSPTDDRHPEKSAKVRIDVVHLDDIS
jgi:hypothetical protein